MMSGLMDPDDLNRGRKEAKALLEEAEALLGEEIEQRNDGDQMNVKLLIDNCYENGEKIRTVVETQIPVPPSASLAALEEWELDYIFVHTGTGRLEGDACYFVTIADSSRPDILPVGTEFEFGT